MIALIKIWYNIKIFFAGLLFLLFILIFEPFSFFQAVCDLWGMLE